MRMQEIHPSLVHYPIALVPLSVGLDLVGTATKNKKLLEFGKLTMPIAAAAAGLAGAAGLLAQEQVQLDQETARILKWHRNINITATSAAAALAFYRVTEKKPSTAYLAGGIGLIGAYMVSAYLGGKMVYGKGVGVSPAGGVRYEESPKLRFGNMGAILRALGRQIPRSLGRTARGFVGMEQAIPSEEDLQDELEAPPGPIGASPMPFDP